MQDNFRPTGCNIVSFQDHNTHRTFINGRNLAFNVYGSSDGWIKFPEGQSDLWIGDTNNNRLRSLIKDLVHAQEDLFFLNEFPSNVRHRLFIDIDMFINTETKHNINRALYDIFTTPPNIKFLTNEESGKLHIILNVWTHPLVRKSELLFLRDYIYPSVSETITKDQWIKAFDINALGIRSAHSVKIQDGQVVSHARYITGLCVSSTIEYITDTAVEYSIYNCTLPTVQFTSAVLDRIAEIARQLQSEQAINLATKRTYDEQEVARSAYNANTNTIPLCGRDELVTQRVIDELVSNMPTEWGVGKKWWVTLQKVHAAGQLIDGFSPDYFLHQWSAEASPEEYNKEANNAKYYRCENVDRTHAGAALTWIRDRSEVVGLPAILDKSILTVYDHYASIKQYDRQRVEDFIIKTIAYINRGGKSIWITKSIVAGEIQFTMIDCNSGAEKNFQSIGWVVNKEGKNTVITLLSELRRIKHRITYSRFEFRPVSDLSTWKNTDKVFNTFTGFYAKRQSIENYSAIQPILDHIRIVLTADTLEIYDYILNWIAHIVQRPEVKPNVAILFKSEQGAGKNCFWEFVINKIIGPRYTGLTNEMEAIIGRFNSFTENKLLIICDEIQNYGGAYKSNDKLKSIITQTHNVIERKGVEMTTVADYCRYVFLTNNDWPIRVEKGDRRYLAIECSNQYVRNNEYFDRLFEVFTQDNANILYTYLMERDISSWSPQRIPSTEIKRELILNSVSSALHWLIRIAKGEDAKFDIAKTEKHSTAELYDLFKEWALAHNRLIGNERDFSKELAKIMKHKKLRIGDRTLWGYVFDGAHLTKCLEDHLGVTIVDDKEVE